MAKFDTAASYFYPPPDDATMRNLLDIRDPEQLQVEEYGAASARYTELILNPSLVDQTYDAEHLRAIHGYLFQDIYEWAGEYRTLSMRKMEDPLGFAEPSQIDQYLKDANRIITSTDWQSLDRHEFGQAAANVFAHVNHAHPFREGNGRASKVFMEHVALQSKFDLDYARISAKAWNVASQFSRPDLYSYAPVPDSLVPVFTGLAVERNTREVLSNDLVGMQERYRAANPRPPSLGTGEGKIKGSKGYAPSKGYQQDRGYER